MTLRWLGQQYGTVTTVGLQRNHVYRARWLVANPIPLLGCGALPLGQIFNLIQDVPGTGATFPADLRILGAGELDSVGWEADKRDVAGRAANECVVYTQMRAITDQLLEIGAMEQALTPVGGRLVDFWDSTDGIVLIGYQSPSSPGGTTTTPAIPPPPDPTVPIPPTPPPIVPPPQPPAPKKKKTPAQVVVPWGLAIAGVSLLLRLIRG